MNVANKIKRSLSYMGAAVNSIYQKNLRSNRNPDALELVEAFRSPLGSLLLELEREKIQQLLTEFGGTKILRVSISPEHCPDSPSQFRTITHACLRGQSGNMRSTHASEESTPIVVPFVVETSFDALPFESKHFDIVIVQHALEFLPKPHGIMKELSRVMKPNGHIFLFAFNPCSFSGVLSALYGAVRKRSIWYRRALFAFRLKDWMRFVDCTPLSLHFVGHSIPMNLRKLVWFNRKFAHIFQSLNMPLSAAICIVARKDQFNMIQAGKRWRQVNVARGLFAPAPNATSQSSAKTQSN